MSSGSLQIPDLSQAGALNTTETIARSSPLIRWEHYAQSLQSRLFISSPDEALSIISLAFRILKLMLGIAVTCNNKQIFIGKIQTLPERTQHSLTKCVAGMMKETDSEADTEGRDSSQSINSDLKAVTPPGDEVWIQKCHELDFQVEFCSLKSLGNA